MVQEWTEKSYRPSCLHPWWKVHRRFRRVQNTIVHSRSWCGRNQRKIFQQFFSRDFLQFGFTQATVGYMFLLMNISYWIFTPVVGWTCDKRPVLSFPCMILGLFLLCFGTLLLGPFRILRRFMPKWVVTSGYIASRISSFQADADLHINDHFWPISPLKWYHFATGRSLISTGTGLVMIGIGSAFLYMPTFRTFLESVSWVHSLCVTRVYKLHFWS